jgi:hypothetical protein
LIKKLKNNYYKINNYNKIMITIKDVIKNNNKKYKDENKKFEKERKERIKDNDIKYQIIVDKMVSYIENYLIENKEIIFEKFKLENYLLLDIKLPYIWKEIYEKEINDKVLIFTDKKINEDLKKYNKFTFYDLELAKYFYSIMSKYLINKNILVKNELYKGCNLSFFEDNYTIQLKNGLLIDSEKSISVILQYKKSKICSII